MSGILILISSPLVQTFLAQHGDEFAALTAGNFTTSIRPGLDERVGQSDALIVAHDRSIADFTLYKQLHSLSNGGTHVWVLFEAEPPTHQMQYVQASGGRVLVLTRAIETLRVEIPRIRASGVAHQKAKSSTPLSSRETAVFRLLLSGATLKEAATILGLSITTVSTYKKRVMQKSGYRNNAEFYNLTKEQLD